EPEEVMELLQAYHATMGRIVLAHDGTLERFAGDSLMVFFNDPLPIARPAEQAVRMALAMQQAFPPLGREWNKRGYELALGCGIARCCIEAVDVRLHRYGDVVELLPELFRRSGPRRWQHARLFGNRREAGALELGRQAALRREAQRLRHIRRHGRKLAALDEGPERTQHVAVHVQAAPAN